MSKCADTKVSSLCDLCNLISHLLLFPLLRPTAEDYHYNSNGNSALCILCTLVSSAQLIHLRPRMGPTQSPPRPPPTVLLYLCSISRRHVCLTANETVLRLRWCFCVTDGLPEVSVVSWMSVKHPFLKQHSVEIGPVRCIVRLRWFCPLTGVTQCRDTIHPMTRHCAVHMNLKPLF